MAQSISLSVEPSSFGNNVGPSLLPPFGHQRRFTSQTHKRRKNMFNTNTLPHRIKQDSRQSTLRRQADVIRYIPGKRGDDSGGDLQHNLFFQTFSPGVHSTPIYRNKIEMSNLQKHNSSSSINQKQIPRIPPPPSVSSNIYLNDYDLFKTSRRNSVPTISRKVDVERQSVMETASLGVESKVIKRRGICGVSWILRLALKDTTVGKIYRKQIGWIVFILVIFILIGGLLFHFSSQISSLRLVTLTNFTQIPTRIVLNTSLSYFSTTTAEPMYSEDANRTILIYNIPARNDLPNEHLTAISSVPDANNKTASKQATFKTEYIAWREKNLQNNPVRVENITNDLTEFCKGCRKALDVCIALAESGIPVCRPAADVADPTGCGGLCALEIEACHLLNQKHLIYTCRPLETLQMCEAEEWRCDNQFCIPKSKRCDGHINCYDRSDETACTCDLAKSFHCGNNTSCLDNSKRCDGIVDCWDGTDEFNCTIECPEDKFTCNNGECIEQSLFCDGLADCADKTDEPRGCGGACRKHEFRCTNGRCILKYRVCNGVDNCSDMSDELNCPSVRTSR